ncbi:hypothetical protein OG897_31525 [Streptomyces sp. NBC_00237]|uniref:hypothetical protein n=1 Tax=Streptomyces sp. NBC_00237 TaxID=2975687 RepID=UPI0022544C83|nr:hypothetical protein [Streptomyces sp. NBC_00237]MCX5205941.1 hypothetical protein [Streptomyces sp. NBC_00237]
MSRNGDPAIEIADVLTSREKYTRACGGEVSLVVPVVLADGRLADLVMSELVAARLSGAIDGRDPAVLDLPPGSPGNGL